PTDGMIASAPATPSNNPDPVFEFDADGGLSGAAVFECRLDDGAWEPCTSPHPFTNLPDGDHEFEVRATDPAGNSALLPVWKWTVDTTAPVITVHGSDLVKL